MIIQAARNSLFVCVCVFIHVCPSPHPLVHLDCWPFYRCLSVLQGLIKVEGLIRGCLKAPLSSAPPLLCVSMASNWAGCQMKGLSVTQVDISGAWESACDCKSTLHCLHINTDMSNVSLLHTLVITVTHTLFGQFSDHQRRTEEKKREQEGKKAGGSGAQAFPGPLSGCDRLDAGRARGALSGEGGGWWPLRRSPGGHRSPSEPTLLLLSSRDNSQG